ncbi:TonB family protein [Stenotrophomonas sp.]|uniref:energy transducer TonB family protein n=1 Tax=Stenotrophomonas sp. TaxID=69392 RepID=UPI0028A83774|nr:TonB family protein [Stenotrophomonas sp.]
MKVAIGIFVALLMLLLVTVFAGWVGVYIYGGVEWIGHLFATGILPDGRAAFRAGVLVGSLVSVGSLLRVAIKDKSHAYAGAALIVGLGFAFMLFATRLSPYVMVAEDATQSVDVATASPAARRSEMPEWYSRSSYERDAAGKVHALARAAARQDQLGVDAGLEELQRWARSGVRIGGDREAFNAARDRFNATFDIPEGRETKGKLSRERHAALRAMWQAVPEVDIAGRRVLVQEMTVLAFALRLKAERGTAQDATADDDGVLDEKLIELIRLQEAILGYAPRSAEFWSSYAATIVDADEEVALGALLIADQLRRSAASGRSAMRMSISDEMLFQSDMRIGTSLLPRASVARLSVLEARAAAINGTTAPVDGDTPTEAGEAASAEQALPAPQFVHTGKGLLPSPRPTPPGGLPAHATEALVRVDLPSAGFEQQQRPVVLPPSGLSSGGSVLVAVDVLADGSISSVLIERSSGDPALDDAVRWSARRWKALTPIAAKGERRRVQLRFESPVPVEEIPGWPPPPMVPGREPVAAADTVPTPRPVSPFAVQHLQELLARQARFNPARYPAAAWKEKAGGRVVLAIRLAGSGEVRGVSIAQSSGNALLDSAAREAALGWRVSPGEAAADVDEVTLHLPVVFRAE